MSNFEEFKKTAMPRLRKVMENLMEGHDFPIEPLMRDDEVGFTATVLSTDDEQMFVELVVTEEDAAVSPNAGNLIARLETVEDQIHVFAPDNRTAECWADFGDTDAWDLKFDALQRHIPVIREELDTWISMVASVTP